jgi:hypothetical protein
MPMQAGQIVAIDLQTGRNHSLKSADSKVVDPLLPYLIAQAFQPTWIASRRLGYGCNG